MFYWNTVEIKCDNFYERTEEWGRVGVEGESGVDFMGGFGWGGQRTISSRRGSLLKFVPTHPPTNFFLFTVQLVCVLYISVFCEIHRFACREFLPPLLKLVRGRGKYFFCLRFCLFYLFEE